ncbi:rna processing protein [Diplodia corticola]|uniref:Polynucleotide 5'-hydroxyl-kinase GRC3 n=1 Tax=Diplodia corticola TaxID=236234 RepID=A0A1J9RC54_9PEZI|nr:rna processing protein [Diplodia corticola]OJD38136.1 rna processing protein [Diplodia corticola]
MVKRRKIHHRSGSDASPAPPQSAAAALRARRQQSKSSSEASAENTPVPASSLEVPARPKRRNRAKLPTVPDKDAATPSSTEPASAVDARPKAIEQRDIATPAADAKPVSAVEARRRALEATAQPISDPTTEVSDDSLEDLEPDYLPRPDDADDSNSSTGTDVVQNSLYPPPIVELSSWTPRRGTVIRNNASGMVARLEPEETLASIGIYDIFVKRGVVTIYGAILRAGPNARSYRVFAPASHALPVIHCLSPDGAEVELKSVECGLHLLEKLSPLYARLWKSESSLDSSFLNHKKRWSFENIHRLSDDALCRPLYHLEIPQKWHQAIDKICSAASKSGPGVYERILVCGPKNTGKSTFARLLLNRMFTIDREAMKTDEHSIFLLDIDPGQPEYSPPGQISLIELRQPIFGPPYTHPSASTGSHQRTIRSHFIGAKSPKDNPEHFIEGVVDLMTHYQKHLSFGNTRGPVVINSPGWIIGTGLQILTTLLTRLSLTDVTYTTDELSRSHDALRAAATSASIPRFQAIPPQPSGTTPSRTAAEFRDMQTLSYFHLAAPLQGSPTQSWDASPLTTYKPYVLSYAATAAEEANEDEPVPSSPSGRFPRDFLAIMPLGEALPPSTLSTVLNGSIIGIVALSPSTTASSPLHSTNIVRTTPEDLPFLSPTATGHCGHIEPLPPQSSHLVCLALVRGIDAARQALHVIVPAACEHLVGELDAPERILLVLGTGMDTPGWAYLEDVHAAEARRRREAKRSAVVAAAVAGQGAGDEDRDEEGGGVADVDGDADADVAERPWVQKMEGGGGGEGEVTGAMGKKRRLRRFVN